MTDHDLQIARCKERIADLALRIAVLKGDLPDIGFTTESMECLQLILDSWRERLTALKMAEAETSALTTGELYRDAKPRS
jgi:hypothetical protein